MLKHSAIKEGSKSKNIDRAGEALDFAKMSPAEQSAYDYYWNISKRSAINTLDAAKKEGKAEGIPEGETKRGIAMAHEMFMDGEDISKIRKYSKLTDAELAKALAALPTEIQARYSLTP